jgi:hypothetical protein
MTGSNKRETEGDGGETVDAPAASTEQFDLERQLERVLARVPPIINLFAQRYSAS